MCFRLLAAVRGQGDLTTLAFSCGLDVRVAERLPTRFVEVAWGDCACSLYTKREGRERVVRFVDRLLEAGPVQLLLMQDDTVLESGAPVTVTVDDFRARALAALPEGRVAELVAS